MNKFVISACSSLILGTVLSIFILNCDSILLTNPPLSTTYILLSILLSTIYYLSLFSYYIISYSKNDKKIQILFYSQIILNIILPILFLYLKLYLISSIIILFLMIETIFLIYYFSSIKKLAGLLNIPYLMYLIILLYLSLLIYL